VAKLKEGVTNVPNINEQIFKDAARNSWQPGIGDAKWFEAAETQVRMMAAAGGSGL